MFTMGRLLIALTLVLAPVMLAVPAEAAPLSHTWVSNSGTDSGDCGSISTPCASFAQAITNTSVGGEITCLNSGEYESPIGISNSITIDCQSSIGSTLLPGAAAGLAIQAAAGSVITLRGLDVDFGGEQPSGQCPNNSIISISGGGMVHLQKMKINHIKGENCSGIFFAPTSNATLDITDSDITDSGSGGTAAGIYIQPQSGAQANVTITRTQVQGNYFGVIADGTQGGTIHATISDSVMSGNTEDGIAAISSGSSVWLLVDQSKLSGNAYGLAAGGSGAEILARNTSVFNNTTGLHSGNGGALYSYGNNSLNGNATNGAFTGTIGLQ